MNWLCSGKCIVYQQSRSEIGLKQGHFFYHILKTVSLKYSNINIKTAVLCRIVIKIQTGKEGNPSKEE